MAATKNDGRRVGTAWSPVSPGRGFASTREQAESFYSEIHGQRRFSLASPRALPRSRRLTRADFGPGGRLNTVDLLYFAGHGSRTGLVLDGEERAVPREYVDSSDIQDWGRDDGLKWAVIDACDVLNLGAPPDAADVIARWRRVFRGLHCLLGFASPVLSWPGRGATFAQLLDRGEPVQEAWKMACEETEGPDDEAPPLLWACLRTADADTVPDRWTGEGAAEVPEAPPAAMELITRPC